MRPNRVLILLVLSFTVLFMLVGCVVTVTNNFGSGITTHKTVDDQILGQDYEADLTKN